MTAAASLPLMSAYHTRSPGTLVLSCAPRLQTGGTCVAEHFEVHLPDAPDKPWAQVLLEVLSGIEAFRQQMPEAQS